MVSSLEEEMQEVEIVKTALFKKYTKKIDLKKFPNVDHVHFYGYYIGNFPNIINQLSIKSQIRLI